jgi:hypothetical protein
MNAVKNLSFFPQNHQLYDKYFIIYFYLFSIIAEYVRDIALDIIYNIHMKKVHFYNYVFKKMEITLF